MKNTYQTIEIVSVFQLPGRWEICHSDNDTDLFTQEVLGFAIIHTHTRDSFSKRILETVEGEVVPLVWNNDGPGNGFVGVPNEGASSNVRRVEPFKYRKLKFTKRNTNKQQTEE